jgi:hypothetical protein
MQAGKETAPMRSKRELLRRQSNRRQKVDNQPTNATSLKGWSCGRLKREREREAIESIGELNQTKTTGGPKKMTGGQHNATDRSTVGDREEA